MKKKNKDSENSNSLKVAFVFVTLLIVLIVISVIFKVITVVKQSKYDGVHKFTVLIYNATNVNVLSFSPDSRLASSLIISSNSKENNKDIAKNLSIPIDSKIQVLDDYKIANDINTTMKDLILNYGNTKTDLTMIDLFRLWNFYRGLSSKNISVEKMDFPVKNNSNAEEIMSTFFLDNSLIQEKNTIEIINGTGISGLGNRLAILINNMGGNVISVKTAEKDIKTSEISYFMKKNYTVEKIEKVLGIKTTKVENSEISDITIRIGEDIVEHLKF